MFDAVKLRLVESLSAAGWSLRAAEVGRSLVNRYLSFDISLG